MTTEGALSPRVHWIEYARRINPRIEVMPVCATKGDGMAPWLEWLERGVATAARR